MDSERVLKGIAVLGWFGGDINGTDRQAHRDLWEPVLDMLKARGDLFSVQ